MTALFDGEGRVTRWPRKAVDRDAVLDYLASKFESGRIYTEAELNGILRMFHTFGDWALLRRELYETKRLDRDPPTARYWVRQHLPSATVA